MMVSVEAQLEAETIAYWFHVNAPLDNWQVYVRLTDGLLGAKRAYRDALARHDWNEVAKALDDMTDLTALCAAAADGLALQRGRFMAGGYAWPLGCLAEYRIEMDWEHAEG